MDYKKKYLKYKLKFMNKKFKGGSLTDEQSILLNQILTNLNFIDTLNDSYFEIIYKLKQDTPRQQIQQIYKLKNPCYNTGDIYNPDIGESSYIDISFIPKDNSLRNYYKKKSPILLDKYKTDGEFVNILSIGYNFFLNNTLTQETKKIFDEMDQQFINRLDENKIVTSYVIHENAPGYMIPKLKIIFGDNSFQQLTNLKKVPDQLRSAYYKSIVPKTGSSLIDIIIEYNTYQYEKKRDNVISNIVKDEEIYIKLRDKLFLDDKKKRRSQRKKKRWMQKKN